MITRIVKAKIKEENKQEFLKFMEGFATETRAFKNNHHVDYFADLEVPNHFHIYTIWKTEGALNKFRKSDININFKAKLTDWSEANYSAWTVQNVSNQKA